MKPMLLALALASLGACQEDVGASGSCHLGGLTWSCSGDHSALDAAAPTPDAAPPAADAPADVPVDVAPLPPPDARPPAPDMAPPPPPPADAAPLPPPPVDAAPPPPPPPAKGLRPGTQLWQLGWMDPSFSFVPGVNFAVATTAWQPALIADLARYTGALRSMDAVATNNTQAATWAQRTARTAGIDAQTSDNGVAWEWWIDLCNRAHRDCWVNIPYRTAVGRNANDYARQLAQLMMDRLDPSLKVYVEYSNEAWNGSFPTLAYTLAQGQALHLDTDLYSNAYRYYAVASAKVFDAFEAVFGKNGPRLVKVLAGQRDNAWLVGVHVDQLRKEGQNATAYALAPYFNGSTLAEMQSDMNTMLDDPNGTEDLAAVAAAVKQNGMVLDCYEGGQENYTSAASVNRLAGMYDLYQTFLTRLDAMGFKDCALYLHVSPFSAGGAWGARESLTQPVSKTASPKWQSILDWIAAHP